MRMRFKPYAHDELMAADFHVHEPLIWGGKWHSQYARPEQPFVTVSYTHLADRCWQDDGLMVDYELRGGQRGRHL